MSGVVQAEAGGTCAGAAGFEATPFVPRKFLSNGHMQTIAGNFLRRVNLLPEATAEFVEVSAATGTQAASEVLCECHWQAKEVRAERLTAILVHGLEGSSDSQYVVGNANKLWRAGANVVRMNMRNCGGSGYEMARRTPTLYHSGLSGDVDRVMRHFIAREGLERVGLVGYSMGGNLVMKLVGELGADAPRELRAVVGVSPAIDLDASATALHRVENRLYERRFVRRLLERFRQKAMLFPQMYDARRSAGVGSVREFDERITAFYSGFASAADYYFRAAAARVVDKIALPALIVQALDDPFVHITPETRAAIKGNRCITLLETEHGGHCAFLAKADGASGDDGYWAETTLVRFLLAQG
jgi:hypothetical protein